jgi:predicted RND superfamily exporter protein
VALSIAGGYAALLISDFKFYPRLGLTMMVTMLISALLSLIFLRAVVAMVRPKFLVEEREPVGTTMPALANEGVAK